MKKLITLDAWIGIALMIFSVFFWVLSGKFPEEAQLFPRFFLIANFALSALLVINTVRHNSKQETEAHSSINWQELALIIEAYLGIMAYIICINFVGFYASTTVFLLAFMLFLNVRKPLVLVGVTAGMDAFFYLLFTIGLKLSLPAGMLF